jgi:tetratricopeptide (TPR) repeat protein
MSRWHPPLLLSGCLLMLLLGPSPSLRRWAGTEKAGELTKEQRDKLVRRADELVKQGNELYQQGKRRDGTKLFEQVVAIYRQLYPKDKYPHGHPLLANSLNNMGMLLMDQGDYAGARSYFLQTLAMN